MEYRNGSEDITVRKIPGLKKFTNITLERGITADLAFWNWIFGAMNGEVQRTGSLRAPYRKERPPGPPYWASHLGEV